MMRARWLVFVLLLAVCGSAPAQDGGGTMGCPDSGILTQGGFLSSLCWNCFFPIEIAGVAAGGMITDLPDDRAQSVCVCPGRFGIPTPGITVGMWQPSYLIETTRGEGCSTVAGGTALLGGAKATLGAGGYSSGGSAFYHTILWQFPVSMVTRMLPQAVCSKAGKNSLGIKQISALDPTWNNDELSMMLTPDALLFTSPVADAACIADAIAATATKPIQALYHCAGAWGRMFPMTGTTGMHNATADDYSLAGARLLAQQHRLGGLKMTYGPVAVCQDIPMPIMPKQQYRFTQMYPIPETLKSRWMGANTTVTGVEMRTVPITGEDFVQTVWTFEQCCTNF